VVSFLFSIISENVNFLDSRYESLQGVDRPDAKPLPTQYHKSLKVADIRFEKH
jgi:hypothetical protein